MGSKIFCPTTYMKDGAISSCARFIWGQNAKGLDSPNQPYYECSSCVRSSLIVSEEQCTRAARHIVGKLSAMGQMLVIRS
jgi:hypothetical protein